MSFWLNGWRLASIRSSHKKLASKAVGFGIVTRRHRKLSHRRLSGFV